MPRGPLWMGRRRITRHRNVEEAGGTFELDAISVYALFDSTDVGSMDASYSEARAGTGSSLSLNDSGIYTAVGQQYSSGGGSDQHTIWQHILGFDTSVITGTPTNAVMSLRIVENSVGDSFDIEARLKDWGPTVSVGDFSPGGDLSSLPLLATFASGDITSLDEYYDFTDVDMIDNLNLSGITRIVLASSKMRLNTAPSGLDRISFGAKTESGAFVPKLTVVSV